MTRPDERFAAILRLFVYRARRVEAHSLATDKSALLKLTRKSIHVEIHERSGGQQAWVVVDLPPEEAMESLASRCRPFVLEGDDVHYGKVIKSLRYFTQSDSGLISALKQQSAAWDQLRRERTEPLGYQSAARRLDEDFGPYVNDRELAYRWLYGDLVHAQDMSDLAHELTSRYEAGVMLTANVAIRVLILLDLLLLAREKGLVDLSVDAFTQEVTARTSRRMEAKMASAPVGTPISVIETALEAAAEADAASGVNQPHSAPRIV